MWRNGLDIHKVKKIGIWINEARTSHMGEVDLSTGV